MRKIVVYGKGGIGKSTVSSHLSYALAHHGKKILQIGCDPKHDSTRRLVLPKNRKNTIIDIAKHKDLSDFRKEDFLMKGKLSIDCIEAGGPSAGVGCAGRGVSFMLDVFEELELLEGSDYDMVIFDVLGDIVCGGFAQPLRTGFGDSVFIVTSEETMSLYAANNIARAVVTYAANGIKLRGIILNLRDNSSTIGPVKDFAKAINTEVIFTIPRSKDITISELYDKTVIEHNRSLDTAKKFIQLAKIVCTKLNTDVPQPNPMNDDEFNKFIRSIRKCI